MAKKNEAAKTEGKKCAISREDFKKKAVPVSIKVGDDTKVLTPREFSTGSFGYHMAEGVVILVDGVPVKCHANCIFTVVGSKEV